jgi:predicted membrane-bound spermidine synthase
MAAKRILPWFGGGAGVWTATMLFFQSALFFGYLYAHLSTRWLSPSWQARLHCVLLAAAVVLLVVSPVVPANSWKPPGNELPVWHILVMLGACVAAPYVMLASTAPLAQLWFSRAYPARSPYRLYALSNLGSMAALLSYPFLVEPYLGVVRQGTAWSILFAVFAVACSYIALKSSVNPPAIRAAARKAPKSLRDAPPRPVDARPAWLRYFFWLALPACASVALLAVTSYLCQDVASIPLLWIVPLALYLLTFILSFDSDRWYRRGPWLTLLAVSSYAAVFIWFQRAECPFSWQLAVHLALLLALGMTCHGELARMRPETTSLTAFYLCIAAGGALGGLFASVVAPLVFPDRYELQLSILAAWLLAGAVMATEPGSALRRAGWRSKAILAGLLVALMAAQLTHVVREKKHTIAQARNFYGVLEVREFAAGTDEPRYYMMNGRISHGVQFRSPNNLRVPTQYYHPDSGIGQLLRLPHDGARRVGIVGLGAGALAAYPEAGEQFVFYEINPQVVDFAERHFTFLADARKRGVDVAIIEGDARLQLERQSPQNYDVLVLDAFNGDSIPVHLLTREAFQLYLEHLRKPGGTLAVHMSNLHLDLAQVLKAAADHYRLDARIIVAEPDKSPAGILSVWVFLRRPDDYFDEHSFGRPLTDATRGRPPVAWTDDYSNVIEILR